MTGDVSRAKSTGCVTQAGAGIAVSRRNSGDFARPFDWLRTMPSHVERPFFDTLIDRRGGEMIRKFAPLMLAAGLLGGCALSSHPRIAELKYNPGRYQHRSVTVDGVVTSSWGVPLLPLKLYKVSDGTGEVTVISQDGRVPTRGARVSVRGRVNDFAIFGGQSIGLHIDQEHLKFRRY
jgi:hypothetical protein